MRRPLALLAVVIALAAAPARAREPLDFDLTLLGAPDPNVWLAIPASSGPPSAADAPLLANDAKVRFARLATDLALAFSASVLQPASTTGHSGFALDLEAAYTGVSPSVIGTAPPYTPTGATEPAYPRTYWPTSGEIPSGLLTPSLHVRKGLPYSLELGGRLIYLARSSYFAGQVEGKWAVVEGYNRWPEVALRVAWTKMMGQGQLDLTTSELDLMTSKRFGLGAVSSLTPYLALRLTRVNASSKVLAFGPDTPTPADPAQVAATSAAFPELRSTLYRTTLGVRFTSLAVSMAAEATYFGGGTQGKKDPGAGDYPECWTPASLAGAFKFGFEF